ncbi:MAG: DUF1329 domain-containing protein [Planctomycetota bacterium]|jgi:hypothetical protein
MRWSVGILASFLIVPGAYAQESTEDVVPGVPFKEGDTLSYEQLEKLRDYLPPEFWENREYFFFEGMEIKVGPFQRPYPNAPVYDAATEKYRGQASIGKDGAIVNYTAGLPFPEIDCEGDPHAGTKIIWNFMKKWQGDGYLSSWSYTYWDRGEQLPLYYEGTAKFIFLSNRSEPQYAEAGAAIFKNDKRREAQGVEVDAPFDARGIMIMTYRYLSSDGPLNEAKNDDTWVYLPDLRRVRRISTAQRTDSVQGTDFTRDDLFTFDGTPPQYSWECLGDQSLIAPFNSRAFAYPYTRDYNFGPYGFSFANDLWELRDAWVISFDPKNDDHPYAKKHMYIDKETYEPLYSAAYDRKNELWKLIWHNHRYSEDWDGSSEEKKDPQFDNGVWYRGWEGVDKPNDVRVVCDIVVNVQTGTGNRIEFWDGHGTPFSSKGKLRRYIDIGRLNKGR